MKLSPAEIIALRALLGRAPAEGIRIEFTTGSVILLPKPAESSAQPEETENEI